MKTIKPTDEQLVALELFRTGQDLAIEAGAGTGKTSTLLLLAQDSDKRGQYIAFNKPIVEEAKLKFPAKVACNTAHSLAMRAVGHKFRGRLNSSARMRSNDIADLLGVDPLKIILGNGEQKYLSRGYLAGLAVRSLTRFCQSADEVPDRTHVPYIKGIDEPGDWQLNRQVAIHIEDAIRRAWRDAIDEDGRLPYKHDYYLKFWHLSGPRISADYILFDEAQDANPVMLDIVTQQTHAQIVWVGDSQQQIYSFTGAINALQKVPADNRAYLTQSFRFGPAIAEVANGYLEALEAPIRLRGLKSIKSKTGPHPLPDVILTRTNARAVRAVLGAIKDGTKVHLVGGGREITDFARAAAQLMNNERTTHPELACFDSWDEVNEYVEQDEQGEDLRLLVGLINEFGVEPIIEALGATAKEEYADLVVSTAHKSKGREWNVVAVADDFPDEPTGEELRLLYVACTRAKLHLDDMWLTVPEGARAS